MNKATSGDDTALGDESRVTPSGTTAYTYVDGDELVVIRPDWITDDAWATVLSKARIKFDELTQAFTKRTWCADHAACINERTRHDNLDVDWPCFSESQEVALSLKPKIEWRTDNVVEAQVMTAYLQQAPSEAEPHIHLGANDEPGVGLTLEEAEQVAALLLELVERGR